MPRSLRQTEGILDGADDATWLSSRHQQAEDARSLLRVGGEGGVDEDVPHIVGDGDGYWWSVKRLPPSMGLRLSRVCTDLASVERLHLCHPGEFSAKSTSSAISLAYASSRVAPKTHPAHPDR